MPRMTLPLLARRFANRLRRVGKPAVGIWHHPAYRLPVAAAEGVLGIEPRRSSFVVSYLLDTRVIHPKALREPERIGYAELGLVHTPELLEALHDPEDLARTFAVDPNEFRVDEILRTIRLACGGTLAATEWALTERAAAFNLLGGFHHAGKSRGAALCPVNDVAVAVAVLRTRGFRGRVNILDLDAHPPDGTAECFRGDPLVWIGSLSGTDWGKLEGVDETVLPSGTGDAEYLAALSPLLCRMPKAELTFVLAGGDVLKGDKMGGLALSLEGARQRDLLVSWYVGQTPQVWLPAGGYHAESWKVLAGSVVAVALDSETPLVTGYQPLRSRFAQIGLSLDRSELEGLADLTLADILGDLRGSQGTQRYLGFYTRDGVEYALSRYGVLEELRRLGYSQFEVKLDGGGSGDRLRLYGQADGQRYLLVECVADIDRKDDVLFVNWLMLQNPRVGFSARRPRLPGQEHPGLGLAHEASELLVRTAERLGLKGVAFRPASYHLAYAGRRQSSFADPERQGRFEALQRDLSHLTLLEASRRVAQGHVHLNGAPYTWEADLMIHWLTPLDAHDGSPSRAERIAKAKAESHFSVVTPTLSPARGAPPTV
ncbi:MAG: histone deacetylase [Polyangiaceae bacterium]|nr:histone deacetylase [Polyangiaceae bacterium]MCW5790414.1 histone deacetylase [Polyangiaceae bacterium]